MGEHTARAGYSSEADRLELDAILDRHPAEDVAEIRALLR